MPDVRICDICGQFLKESDIGHIYYDYLYCPSCWTVHLENVKKESRKQVCVHSGDLEF